MDRVFSASRRPMFLVEWPARKKKMARFVIVKAVF